MTKFIDFLLEWNELQFILAKISDDFLLIFWDLRGAKVCKSCRSRKMLKNAPTLAIVAVHTAENEPLKISLVHFISSITSLPRPRRACRGPRTWSSRRRRWARGPGSSARGSALPARTSPLKSYSEFCDKRLMSFLALFPRTKTVQNPKKLTMDRCKGIQIV